MLIFSGQLSLYSTLNKAILLSIVYEIKCFYFEWNLQKKTAIRGEVDRSLSNILKFTASISSSSSLKINQWRHWEIIKSLTLSNFTYCRRPRAIPAQTLLTSNHHQMSEGFRCGNTQVQGKFWSHTFRFKFNDFSDNKWQCTVQEEIIQKASPFGQWRILQFDHLDAIHVALIVDVLQLRDDLVTSSAVLLIWNMIRWEVRGQEC